MAHRPGFQVSLARKVSLLFGSAVLLTITATLTFNGTTQTGQTYAPGALVPGNLIVVAQQVSTAVTTSAM